MALQETVLIVANALALAVAGLVSRKQLLLGLGGEHVALGVGYAVFALMLYETETHEGVGAIVQFLAHEVAIKLLGVETVNGLKGEAFAIGAFPLGIVEDNHEQERLYVNVVLESQHLMAEGQGGVGLAELYHPLLVFAELDAVVVEVPVDVALELVDKLLLGETVNALRHKGLVVAHGSHHTMG